MGDAEELAVDVAVRSRVEEGDGECDAASVGVGVAKGDWEGLSDGVVVKSGDWVWVAEGDVVGAHVVEADGVNVAPGVKWPNGVCEAVGSGVPT